MTVLEYVAQARRRFGLTRNTEGQWLCQRCKSVELSDDGKIDFIECAPCSEISRQEQTEREQRYRQEELERAIRSRTDAIETAPVWSQCPALPPDLSKMPKEIRRMVEKYEPKQSLVILGPPGLWKTMGTVALLHRIKNTALEDAQKLTTDDTRPREYGESGRDVYIFGGNVLSRAPSSLLVARTATETILGALWVSALDLVQARRQHPLGRSEDAELIVWAKRAALLVVDEVGPQAQSDRDQVLMEVVDDRYRRQAPTIITSGMSPEQFQTAHGAGLWRRLTETGIGRLLKVAKSDG